MSTLHDSCCLLSVKKKYDFQVFCIQCIINLKQLLDLVFVISRITKVSLRFISLSAFGLG